MTTEPTLMMKTMHKMPSTGGVCGFFTADPLARTTRKRKVMQMETAWSAPTMTPTTLLMLHPLALLTQGPGGTGKRAPASKNFVDTDYPEDTGIWKPTAMYPMDNVQRHDLVFSRSPASNRADGLLFDPTGMSPLDFFYKMWPCKLFDHISAETNRHYNQRATEGHNN